MLGFSPTTSPPHCTSSSFAIWSLVCTPVSWYPFPSLGPHTSSAKPVLSQSSFAKDASSIWNRSLTLTASPLLGLDGVVTRGRVERNRIYVLHNETGKKLGITYIWFGSRGSKLSWAERMKDGGRERGGQEMWGEELEAVIGGLEFGDEEAGDLEFFLFFGGISVIRLTSTSLRDWLNLVTLNSPTSNLISKN